MENSNHLFPLESVKKNLTRSLQAKLSKKHSCEIWFFCKFLIEHWKKTPHVSSFRTSKGQVQLIAKPSGRENQNQQQHLRQVRHVRWVFFCQFFPPPQKSCGPVQWSLYMWIVFWTSNQWKSLELPLLFLFPKKTGCHLRVSGINIFSLIDILAWDHEELQTRNLPIFGTEPWNWGSEIKKMHFLWKTTWCKWWSNKRKPIKSRVFKGKKRDMSNPEIWSVSLRNMTMIPRPISMEENYGATLVLGKNLPPVEIQSMKPFESPYVFETGRQDFMCHLGIWWAHWLRHPCVPCENG